MGFYSNEVKFFLEFSELAREDGYVLKKKYPKIVILDDQQTDTQGFILPSGSRSAIIAFRGTQQNKDWMTDINAFHVVYPYENTDSDIMVHRGFINAYKSIRSIVHDYINDHELDKVYVCGHSLGGALATLCAVDIQYNFSPDIAVECYPSGNPKVGNKAFTKSYDKRVPHTIRTYIRTDIVPWLPPRFIEKMVGQRSYHCGQANPIGPVKGIFVGLFRWIKFKFVRDDRFLDDITNHDIDLYKHYA